MFCIKCGKPNDEDALFCEFCGVQLNNPTAGGQAAPAAPAPIYAPAPAPVQAPMQAPVYAAAAAPKRSKKGGVVAVIISVAVLAIAAALYVFLFMNKGSKPKLTVNGKNIPVDLAMMGSDKNYIYFGMAGETDDEIFQVVVGFYKDDEPKGNTTINSSDSDCNIEVGFGYLDDYRDADEFSVKIGKYVSNEYIELTVSGKAEIAGRTYDFKASGKVKYYANYNEMGEEWYDKHRDKLNR